MIFIWNIILDINNLIMSAGAGAGAGITYFIYCEYDDTRFPKALFVPSNDLQHKNEIEAMSVFNKIKHVYKWDDNEGTPIGYNIGDKFDNTDQTKHILNHWSNLLSCIYYDHEGYFPDEYFIYTIKDKNYGRSPSELYDILSNLKIYDGEPISVSHCVMVIREDSLGG